MENFTGVSNNESPVWYELGAFVSLSTKQMSKIIIKKKQVLSQTWLLEPLRKTQNKRIVCCISHPESSGKILLFNSNSFHY